MLANHNDIIPYIQKEINTESINYTEDTNSLICHVKPEYLEDALLFFKNDEKLRFTLLTDIFAVDFPDKNKRFEVSYNLLSLEYNSRIIVRTAIDDEEMLPSAINIYQAAGWFEREVWDMYGIIFTGNHDLRRILTDYGFQGHPLRKDFPLTGYVELRYDLEHQKVMYEPVNLTQEFRNFDFLSPWEGPNYVLPGDEKSNIGK